MNEQWPRVKQVLNDLLAADPDDPEAWLDDRCEDPALRVEVESLYRAYRGGTLSAGDEAAGWLGAEVEAAFEVGGTDAAQLRGQRVGPYRLTDEIGVGGMSVVYRGERIDGEFERTVAVKLLQRRLHAEDAEQRFRAERQVLASLDHPSIAGLLDGGVTEGGRPYLVMELVEGTPITEYADEKNLSVDARLELLAQVFGAVEAAHRQLVVHRDLKPSNVFVTETDEGEPRVKLLDFGIAKLLGDALPVTAPQTETGHHLMTPTYAAPEQVSGAEVTTRTDVYQLGVLAYELLAGARPFDLEGKSLTEIERTILETEPPAPSDAAAGRDERGRADDLRGDLDVIVLKALRKEPERRYRSVDAFAEDLRRHRAGEPVAARPSTLRYRTKKFVTRHATGVGVAAAFLLVIAVAGALLVQQRNRALRNAERARENARRAQREAETAEQVSDFLVNLMQRSNPYGPSRSGDSTLTVREALERGADRIDEFDGQPAVQAELRTVIGTSFERLGRLDKAGSMLKAAVAQRRRIQAPDTTIAQSLHRLADYHEEVGNYEAADSLYLEALSIRRSVLGPNHRDVATTLSKLGSIRWYNMGDFAAADSFLQEALRIRKTVFDTAHVELATIYNNLASLYHRQADYDQAETYYRNAIDMYRRLHGQHPDLGIVQGNFAVLLRSRGKYDEAETAMRAAIATQREMVGENSIDVALRTASLGRILLEQGRLAAADSVYDVARSKLRALYDPPHPYLVKVTWGEGEIRRRRGKLDAAERLFRDAQSALKEVYPPDHQNHAKPLVGLGQIRMEQGRLAAADSLFSEALALRTDAFGANNWLVAVTQGELGRCRTLQGRYREADSLLTTAYDVLRNKRPEGERYRTRVRHALVQLYERWGRPEAAEKYRQGAKAQAGTD